MQIGTWIRLFRRGTTIAILGGALSAFMIGCGGGGGGGTPANSANGRSFTFTNGTQVFTISVDSEGRFTVFSKDNASLAAGAGAQGSLAANGDFSAQSEDATVQFAGNISNGSTATGTVRKNGTTVIAFTAPMSTAGTATPSAQVGSYFGTTGTTSAFVTIDAGSHATLFANVNGATGGGLLNLLGTGQLTSDDGSFAGQLTSTGASTFTLQITKLGGAAVNGTVNLTRVARARWTFMVFLNAANNLQEFAPLNVNQMEKVGSTQDVNMVVQWKQANCAPGVDCGSPEWVGTRRYFIKKDNNTSTIGSQLVEDMGQSIDMGDWRELRNFILWTQQHYPADHYALVIWNHGAGWRPTRAGSNRMKTFPRSVSIDDSTDHEIQIWDLPQALNVTPKMDMVIFDASLMQMTEVAYEIRNSTPFVVGSEESPPGQGYIYDAWLSDLVGNPNLTAQQLGTIIVNKTLDEPYQNDQTQSVIDSSKMQAVATALDAFGISLLNHKADSSAAMINARNQAQNYAYVDNKDLWDYAELIKNGTSSPADLRNAATNVQNAIAAAALTERHGAANARSHGLAIYVPSKTGYLASYANLALARATSWPQWLQNQP